MSPRPARRLGVYLPLCGVCVAILVATAQTGGVRRIPVSGAVTLDGRPLESDGLVIQFHPDASKGNTARVACSGRVTRGHYELNTSGVVSRDSGPGAPPGWYKVVVIDVRDERDASGAHVHSRYYREEQTPLSVEVVENPQPGQYAIKFTSE